MRDLMAEGDAGFGTYSVAELKHLTPEQLAKVDERRAKEQSLGTEATRYTFLGVESTMDTTREERQRLSEEEGISSHPIGWGVVFSRRETID